MAPGPRRAAVCLVSACRDVVEPGPHYCGGMAELPPNPYNAHAWFVATPTVGEGTWIGAFTVIDGSGGLTIGKRV